MDIGSELCDLRLSHAYDASRSEAKRLVVALGQQSEGDSRFITERLAELDLRANQIETRLAEIQKAMLAMASRPIDRTDIANALSLFNPVWDGLKPASKHAFFTCSSITHASPLERLEHPRFRDLNHVGHLVRPEAPKRSEDR